MAINIKIDNVCICQMWPHFCFDTVLDAEHMFTQNTADTDRYWFHRTTSSSLDLQKNEYKDVWDMMMWPAKVEEDYPELIVFMT